MATETNSKIGEMVWLAQVTKHASLGNEPWARNVGGHMLGILLVSVAYGILLQ